METSHRVFKESFGITNTEQTIVDHQESRPQHEPTMPGNEKSV